MPPPLTLAIIGAGKRGEAYADYAKKHPELARVVAVAEPRPALRNRMAAEYQIPPERCFDGYEAFAAEPKLCDAIAICTQDRMHLGPVEALAPKGYAILLEKPMSPDLDECERIVACVKQHGNLFACCHVLLYTELTRKPRDRGAAGRLGKTVKLHNLEPVAWWHQAHSFVRGNWNHTATSSFMLMAKSCHDLDWLRHLIARPCRQVASFGSLRHFKPSEMPAGAADRCLECPPAIETTCPYSAKQLYLGRFGRDWIIDYLNDVITAGDGTRDAVTEALATGPYGRCVYACDNDVVDNQSVMLEFEGPVTATFTMTAFTPTMHRATRIFGTRGYIETDFITIKVFDFLTEIETVHDPSADPDSATAAAGHGGGDYFLMKAFVRAATTGDTSGIFSGPDATLESHRLVFAAEKARLEGRIIHLPQLR